MYEHYYGLRERPFDLSSNTKFLFLSPQHHEALTHLRYGLSGRPGITHQRLATRRSRTSTDTLLLSGTRQRTGDQLKRQIIVTGKDDDVFSSAPFVQLSPFFRKFRCSMRCVARAQP